MKYSDVELANKLENVANDLALSAGDFSSLLSGAVDEADAWKYDTGNENDGATIEYILEDQDSAAQSVKWARESLKDFDKALNKILDLRFELECLINDGRDDNTLNWKN